MSHLEKLAEYSAALKLESVPKEAVEAAKLCVLDTVGVAIGARDDAQVASVKKAFGELEKGCESVEVWGGGGRLSAFRAAYVNAMMGHTLELDDVHVRSKTHIGTVVIPAAWAMAERLGRSGKEFLEAVICGYEIMSRIGMGFGVSSHREKGWHVTATAGTFGGAIATAKVMGLSAGKSLHALGLAGTQSFGLWSFLEDGATNKPMHPAHAAMSGMESAVLAGAGMTGPVNILDAKDGSLYRAMSDAPDFSLVHAGLGERYEVLYLDKKPYPCCRSTHCAIDAALRLRREHSLTADKIDNILVKTYKVGYMQVGCTAPSLDPKLPSDAKFSTPYVVACAIIDGEVGLGQFEPAAISRPDVGELLKRVKVAADDVFTARYPKNWGCEMIVTTVSGEKFSLEVPDASGSVGAPMSADAVMDKAVVAARMAMGDKAKPALERILNMEKVPSLRGFFQS